MSLETATGRAASKPGLTFVILIHQSLRASGMDGERVGLIAHAWARCKTSATTSPSGAVARIS